MTKIHDYINDGTSDPIKNLDYLDMDNEDGLGGYDASKKILVSEFITFVQAAISSVGGGGTLNTVAMFTPDGATVGDSPLTVDTGDVTLLSGTLGIGIAADPETDLYVVGTPSNTNVGWIESSHVGTGNDIQALHVRSILAGPDGTNVAGDFSASRSTGPNIAIKAKAGFTGIGFDPETDGFDRIGGVFQSASDGARKVAGFYSTINGAGTVDSYGGHIQISNTSTGDTIGLFIDATATTGTPYIGQLTDGNEAIGKVLTCVTADGKAQWADAGAAQVIGGVFCTVSALTTVINGTYVIFADTTAITPVNENVTQNTDWTLEYTGTATVKKTLQLTVNVVKGAGGGENYDFALFKNNVLIPESELPEFKLESAGKGRSVVITVPVECATNDLFTPKISGNGTADDVECSGGTLILY